MSCADAGCPLEGISQSPDVSPGVIQDDEVLGRVAYSPMHVNKGNLKSSITEPGKLIGGGISVWRTGANMQQPELIAGKMPGREGQTFAGVYGVSAGSLRSARVASYGGRLFCVIDDCVTDAQGSTDPFHAGIRLCNELLAQGITKESALFLEVQAQLRLRLSHNKLC